LEFFVGGRPVVNVLGSTTNTTPTFTWKAVDGASGYEIFVQKANPAPNEAPILRRGNISTTSFMMPSALGKGSYRVWVRAINAATGAASLWSEGPSTHFSIVDASEAHTLPQMEDYVLTTVPENLLDASTESTISMLPARIAGSSFTEVIDFNGVDTEQPGTPGAPGPEVVIPGDETTGVGNAQADQVLAKWDEQLWWDAPAEAPVVTAASEIKESAQKSASSSSAIGFFGALLAFAPRSLRRRISRDEEKA
jgi:hypothetical protein